MRTITMGLMFALAAGSWMPASAADWSSVTSASDGMKVAIDYHTVKRVGPIGQAWFLLDYSRVRSVKARSAKVFRSLNCDEHSSLLLYAIGYDARGAVIDNQRSADVEALYDPVPPGSIGEDMMEAVCRQPQR